MPELTFPIAPDGLWVPVMIGLGTADLQLLQAAGKPLPRPLHVRDLLDTGADVTSVVPRVVVALGALPDAKAKTQTASGSAEVSFYRISLTVYDPENTNAPTLFRPEWRVTNMPQDIPGLDVLIGLDLIRQITLVVNGPQGIFTLIF